MRYRPEFAGIPESPIIRIGSESQRTPGAINLCYGESDIPTPEFICQAAYEASLNGHTFYTHTAGSPELREAIAEKVHALHGVEYSPSGIVGTVGATLALYGAIRAFVGTGDNAVIVSPSYPSFPNAVTMAGGEPRPVPLVPAGSGHTLDLDRMRTAIDSRTRMLIVNSPANPTGWMISVAEQRALVELAARHDLVILSDEVYERLTFDAAIAPSFATVVEDRDRLVVANSFSKTYNMTGWRLGWLQSTERTAKIVASAAEFITSNPAAMVQQAGIVALRDGESWVKELRANYTARREQTLRALSAVPGLSVTVPSGGFFAWMRVDGLTDSATLAEKMVREAKVALAPGSCFGTAGEGHLRICFAASEETLTAGLDRVVGYLGARS